MRVGFVVNPEAGDGKGRARVREAQDLLAGHDLVRRETDPEAGAGPAAAKLASEVDVVAPVGGDGTLREVVAALADREAPPLLPVPAGRGNSTATHLHGEDGWRDLAAGLDADPPTRPLDAGLLEGEDWGPRTFVLGASTGLLVEAVRAADGLRALPGRVAYGLATVGAWFRGGPEPVAVTVDGEALHDGPARMVLVAGAPVRGGGVPVAPGASLRDGEVDVLVVGDVPLHRAPRVAWAVLAGAHRGRPEVRAAAGREVRIRRDEAGPVELDGTVFPEAPARLSAEVLSAAAEVLAPVGVGGHETES